MEYIKFDMVCTLLPGNISGWISWRYINIHCPSIARFGIYNIVCTVGAEGMVEFGYVYHGCGCDTIGTELVVAYCGIAGLYIESVSCIICTELRGKCNFTSSLPSPLLSHIGFVHPVIQCMKFMVAIHAKFTTML
jgi:hypothetical protein